MLCQVNIAHTVRLQTGNCCRPPTHLSKQNPAARHINTCRLAITMPVTEYMQRRTTATNIYSKTTTQGTRLRCLCRLGRYSITTCLNSLQKVYLYIYIRRVILCSTKSNAFARSSNTIDRSHNRYVNTCSSHNRERFLCTIMYYMYDT